MSQLQLEGDVIALTERVNELERWRDEIAERLGTLEGDMRGVNEWVADTAQVVAVADDTWPGDQ